jgi:prephenate dehydrogenase
VQRLAIVGTGLIGASVGLAARAAGVARCAAGSRSRRAARRGRARRGRAGASLQEALDGAELAVVARRSRSCRRGRDVLAASGDGTTVTDVGSTKGRSRAPSRTRASSAAIRLRLAHARRRARERRALPGATWFLTPRGDRSGALPHAARLRRLARARAGRRRPEAHDRLVALTSHLPHALANLLLNQAGASRIDGTSRSRRPAARCAT